MNDGFTIEALDAHHDRSTFSCGVSALDRYLREQAAQDMRRFVSSCFLLVHVESGRIAGYYTLAATSVLAEDVSKDVLKKLPRYPVLPAALVGRLAVEQSFRDQGLGGLLLADAALRVLHGDLKALAVVVDARDESAVSFYRAQGFQPLASRPMSLFLPLATFGKAMAS